MPLLLAERFGHSIRLRCSAPSDLLRPDPLQGLAELAFAHRSCQISLSQGAADPPDLETAKGKGEQTQLEVSRVQVVDHATCFAISFIPALNLVRLRSIYCLIVLLTFRSLLVSRR